MSSKMMRSLLILCSAILFTACITGPAPSPLPEIAAWPTPTPPLAPTAVLAPNVTLIPAPPTPTRRPTYQPTPLATGSGDAQNVDLVGQLGGPISAALIQGDYAYLGVNLKLVVLDISDPTHPRPLGDALLGDKVSAISAWGDYAYVGALQGLYIVDVSDPTAPKVVGFYDSPGWITDLAAMKAVPGSDHVFLYMTTYTGTYGEPGQLLVVDVSDPVAPLVISVHPAGAQTSGVTLVSDSDRVYAYLAELSACQPAFSRGFDCTGALRILDVSDPAAPVEIAYYELPTWARDVAVRDGYAYVAEHHFDMDKGTAGGLQILDVSNPSDPRPVGRYERSSLSVKLAGDYLYVDGLGILDVSDPTSPAEIRSGEPPWDWVEAVDDGYAYLVNRQELHVVDVSDPAAPVETGLYDPPGLTDVRDVAVTGSHAYVVDWGQGLQVVDISDPTHPTPLGLYAQVALGQVWGQRDHILYLGNAWGLHIIDVSDPLAPTEIGAYVPSEGGRILALMDGYAYVTDVDADGMRIIDLRSPATPREAGFYEFPNIWNVVAETAAGSYAYLAVYEEGAYVLHVLDLSNPVAPQEVGLFRDLPLGNLNGMLAADQRLYVPVERVGVPDEENYWGFQIIDLSNPASPETIGVYRTEGPSQTQTAVNHRLYLVDKQNVLRVVDLTAPARPVQVAAYQMQGLLGGLALAQDLMYLATQDTGLVILPHSID